MRNYDGWDVVIRKTGTEKQNGFDKKYESNRELEGRWAPESGRDAGEKWHRVRLAGIGFSETTALRSAAGDTGF